MTNETMPRIDERADWASDWDELISLVGTDFSDGTVRWGADRIEPGAIRRYLEPLELADPIHYDEGAARRAGYSGIAVPVTGLLSWAIPPMWRPGEAQLFDSAEADAQPTRSPINNEEPYPKPDTTGFFTASMDLSFHRPVVAGERIGQRGRRLVSVTPKQTSVGRGAFISWEYDLVSDRGDVVAVVRNVVYAYNRIEEPQ
ncbi:FAS1-like dehydratase domain-containing protein [Gordonia sp. (in: high G+C Gram-positive bacteria)]|uniref:FAS1-like dehydratase domain-containing protein n=1 Tax=Gordonia sp. (in: high G+C Gram-positive bacteria) TaxID=84139 RepID=UPI003F953C99